MITVSQLVAKIRADYQQFMQGIGAVSNRLNQLVTQTRSAGGQIRGNMAGPWGYVFTAANTALGSTIQSLRSLSQRITDTGRDFNYLAYIASSVLAGVAAQAVKTGFSFTEMSDRAIRAFRAMMGAQKGGQFFEQVKAFAIPTPFETPELIRYAQSLKNAKIATDDILPSLKAVGDYMTRYSLRGAEDMAGALKALTDMMYKGKVQGEELTRQLTNHGVPGLRMLADQAGVTTKQMNEWVKKGLIPTEWAFKAIIYQMEKRAPNAMKQGMRDMSVGLAGLRDVVSNMLGGRGTTGKSGLLVPAYDDFTNFVQFAISKFQTLGAYIESFSKQTKNRIAYGFAIGTAIAPATIAFEALFRVMRMGLNPFGLLAAALGAVTYYLSQNRGEAEKLRQSLVPMIPVVIAIFTEFSKLAMNIGQSLVPVLQTAINVVSVVVAIVAKLLEWFNKLPPPIRNFIILLEIVGVLFNPIVLGIERTILAFSGMATVMRLLSGTSLPMLIRFFASYANYMGPIAKMTLALGISFRAMGAGIGLILSPLSAVLGMLGRLGRAKIPQLNIAQNIGGGVQGLKKAGAMGAAVWNIAPMFGEAALENMSLAMQRFSKRMGELIRQVMGQFRYFFVEFLPTLEARWMAWLDRMLAKWVWFKAGVAIQIQNLKAAIVVIQESIAAALVAVGVGFKEAAAGSISFGAAMSGMREVMAATNKALAEGSVTAVEAFGIRLMTLGAAIGTFSGIAVRDIKVLGVSMLSSLQAIGVGFREAIAGSIDFKGAMAGIAEVIAATNAAFASGAITGMEAFGIRMMLAASSVGTFAGILAKGFLASLARMLALITGAVGPARALSLNTGLLAATNFRLSVSLSGVVGWLKNLVVLIGTGLRTALTRTIGLFVIFNATAIQPAIAGILNFSRAVSAYIIVNGGFLGAVRAGVTSMFGFVRNAPAVTGALAAIRTALLSVNWVVALIAVAIVAFTVLWAKNWHNIRGVTEDVANNVIVFFRFMGEAIATVVTGIADWIAKAWNVFTTFISNEWKALSDTFSGLKQMWDEAFKGMEETSARWYKAVVDHFGFVGTAAEKMGGFVKSLWQASTGILSGIPGIAGLGGTTTTSEEGAFQGKSYIQTLQDEWKKQADANRKAGGVRGLFGSIKGAMGFGPLPKIDQNEPEWLKKLMEDLKNPGKPTLDRSSEAEKEAKRLQDRYKDLVHDMTKEIALYGDVSEAAKMRWETEKGELTGLGPKQKSYLVSLAQQVDGVKAAETADKRYKEVIKQMAETSAKYREEIRIGARDTESMRVQIDLAKISTVGMTSAQIQTIAASKDAVVALVKVAEATKAITKIDKEIAVATLPKWLQDVSNAVGGIDTWNEFSAQAQDKFIQRFKDLTAANDVTDLTNQFNDMAVSLNTLGHKSLKDAVDFAGGLERWRRLPPIIRQNVELLVSLQNTLGSMNEMRFSALDSLYDSIHPIQTETEKAIHAIDDLIARGDKRIKLGLDKGDLINPGLPDKYKGLGRDLNTPTFGIGELPPSDFRDVLLPKDLRDSGYAKLFKKEDLSNLVKAREELVAINKAIDWNRSRKQMRDWTIEFNNDVAVMNAKIAGTYTEADNAAKQWLFDNRDTIELIRRSYEQLGKPAEDFNLWLDMVSAHLQDMVQRAREFEGAMNVVQKIAEIKNGIAEMSDVDSFTRFTRQFYEWDQEVRDFKLPAGMLEGLHSLYGLGNTLEQLKRGAENALGLLREMDSLTAKGDFEQYVAQFKEWDATLQEMALPPGFNKDFERLQFNARQVVEAFKQMSDANANVQKLYAQITAKSPFEIWLLDFEQFNVALNKWELPSNVDRDFMQKLYNYQQKLTAIQKVSDSLATTIMSTLSDALKPDSQAAQEYQSLLKEIRDTKRELWSADEQDKEQIAEQIRDLEKKAEDMKGRVHRSVSDTFKALIGAIYQSFSKMLVDIAADIIKAQLAQVFSRMIMGILGVGKMKGPDPAQAQTAALAAQMAQNTFATQSNTAAQQAQNASLQALGAPLTALPDIQLQLIDLTSQNMGAMFDLGNALMQTTDSILLLKDSIDANTFTIQQQQAQQAGQQFASSLGSSFAPTGSAKINPTSVIGMLMSIFPYIFGRRAEGGFVESGGSYLVGEQGPEVVTFPKAGMVSPHRAVSSPEYGGGKAEIHIHYHMPPGTDVPKFRRASGNIMADARRQTDKYFKRNR